MLAETIAGEADEPDFDIERLAKRMVEKSHRVARIIDDLLELAKIEFDGVADQAPVDIQTILTEAVGRVNAVAGANEIFISSAQIDEGIVCHGDARQLVSAITNLCENAVKYSNVGAQVDVVTERILGGSKQIAEAARRRRLETGPDAVFVEHLLGLKLSHQQLQSGRAFIDGVLQRGGEDALLMLTTDAGNLPTPNELDAPGLWIARLELQ